MSRSSGSWHSSVPPSRRYVDRARRAVGRESGSLASGGAVNRHLLVSGHLLTREKKSDILAAAVEQALRPAGLGIEGVHRRQHVQQHPLGEEVRDSLGG